MACSSGIDLSRVRTPGPAATAAVSLVFRDGRNIQPVSVVRLPTAFLRPILTPLPPMPGGAIIRGEEAFIQGAGTRSEELRSVGSVCSQWPRAFNGATTMKRRLFQKPRPTFPERRQAERPGGEQVAGAQPSQSSSIGASSGHTMAGDMISRSSRCSALPGQQQLRCHSTFEVTLRPFPDNYAPCHPTEISL